MVNTRNQELNARERTFPLKGYKDKQRDSLEQLQTVTKCSYSEAPQRKSRYYSTRLSEDQNLKEMWKTLNKILPKKTKTAAEIENLSAAKFNQYFTAIAGS